jgi:hypothetical protein
MVILVVDELIDEGAKTRRYPRPGVLSRGARVMFMRM